MKNFDFIKEGRKRNGAFLRDFQRFFIVKPKKDDKQKNLVQKMGNFLQIWPNS